MVWQRMAIQESKANLVPETTPRFFPQQGLIDLGYDIVSTGGSASAIASAGLPVKKVEEVTGFPEMLDGALAGR